MSKLVIVEVDEKDSEEAILLLSTIAVEPIFKSPKSKDSEEAILLLSTIVKELNGINESLNQLVTMIKEKRS